MSKAKSKAKEVSELFQPNEFLYSDEEDFDTGAKTAEFEDEEAESIKVPQRSSLRVQNAALLDDDDERYAGEKVSRKTLSLSDSKGNNSLEEEDDDMEFSSSDNERDESENSEETDEEEEEEAGEDIDMIIANDKINRKVSETNVISNSEMSDQGEGSDVEEDSDGGSEEELGSGSEDLQASEENGEAIDAGVSEKDKQAEVEKGRATQRQLRIWDTLLETRIRLQKALIESNKLPQNENFNSLVTVESPEEEKSSVICSGALQACQSSIKIFMENLLEFQNVLLNSNSETKNILGTKRKLQSTSEPKTKPTQDEDDNDEEITSSEDEKEDNLNEKTIGQASIEKSDHHISTSLNKKIKRRRIEDYEKEINSRYKSFNEFRNQTIQKWNEKTQITTGIVKKNFSSFQISTLKQIEQILADRVRLVKRTQLKRSQYEIIGKEEEEAKNNENQHQVDDNKEEDTNYDPEIFDDDDFYHQLLRELIERKTSNVTDPFELSRHWLQLQKLRSKMKRKVDTKASKGRKIRYDIHPKLVNFMAPYDECPLTENAVNELFSSLFGTTNYKAEA